MMNTRKRVPQGFGLGTWSFGGDYWGEQPQNDSLKVIGTALRNGIHHFDTAPAYGNGKSEQILGQNLRQERENLFISSKFFPTLPVNVEKGLNKTLKRLMTDRIDGYYLHWPNERCDLPGILKEVTRLKDSGVIGKIGVSNFSLPQLKEAENWAPIELYQGAYNLAWTLGEEEILPYCRTRDIDFVAYSPLAQGLLTAPARAQPPRDGRKDLLLLRHPLYPVFEEFRNQLNDIAKANNRSPLELAASWVSGQPGIRSVLFGARRREQLEILLKAVHTPLSTENRAELDFLAKTFRTEILRNFPADENLWGHRR